MGGSNGLPMPSLDNADAELLFLKMDNDDQTAGLVTKADWQNVLPNNADEAFVALSWAQLFGKQPVKTFLDYNTYINATPGGFEVFKSAKVWLTLQKGEDKAAPLTADDCENACPGFGKELFAGMGGSSVLVCGMSDSVTFERFLNTKSTEVVESAKVWLTLQKGEDKAAPLTADDCESACPGFGKELFAGLGGSSVFVCGMEDSVTFEQFLNTKSTEVVLLTKVWLTLQKGEDKAAPLTADDCENACPGYGKELFAGMGGSSVLVCGMSDSVTFERFLNIKSAEFVPLCMKLCPIAENVSRDEDVFEGNRRMADDDVASDDNVASVDRF